MIIVLVVTLLQNWLAGDCLAEFASGPQVDDLGLKWRKATNSPKKQLLLLVLFGVVSSKLGKTSISILWIERVWEVQLNEPVHLFLPSRQGLP